MTKLDTPWLPAVLVALLMLALLLSQLPVHRYDPSYFIHVGDQFVAVPDDVPANVYIVPDSPGYDGRAYYQMVLRPWLGIVNSGLYIGNPPYREQRPVYPALVRLLSLANPALVPGMMVLVNYLGLCVLGWLGGRVAQLHSWHALWGGLFALYPGFLFTLTRDLTEIVSAMFLLAGVVAMHSPTSRAWPALWLTLAVFSRETSLLAVLAVGAAMIIRQDYARWPVVVAPLALFGLWQAVLWAKWGVLPVMSGGYNLGLPGIGIEAFLGSLKAGNAVHGVWLAEVVYMAVVALAATIACRRTAGLLPYKLAWLGYGLLVVMLTRSIWVEDLAYMRAMTEFYLFGLLLVFAGGRPSLLNPVAALTAATWALVFFTRLDW